MKRSVTLLVFAGVLCACGNLSHEDSGIRSVVLTKPVVLDSVCVVNYPGIVREAHTISLGFKTAGQIERIHVREGDYVRKGDLLAELDDADYRLGVEALQIQYNQVKDEVDRMERLFGQKSISANDYEKAVAGLKQLGVQLQVSKNKLAYTRLYAPINGYIQRVNFSPAEMVDAGTALFTLLDVSQMEVVADIPLNEYKQRDYFIRYYCKAAGVVGELPMTLLGFTPKADGNQLYQLRLTFEEYPDEQITAGMKVEVGIVVKDGDPDLRRELAQTVRRTWRAAAVQKEALIPRPLELFLHQFVVIDGVHITALVGIRLSLQRLLTSQRRCSLCDASSSHKSFASQNLCRNPFRRRKQQGSLLRRK